jgi:hypothetical protein
LLCGAFGQPAFRKGDHAGIGADRAGKDPGTQYQSPDIREPAQRNVYLAGSERGAGVDDRFFKGQSLAFVDGDRPGQADRILGESPQFLFFDPVFLLVVLVSDIFPGLFFQDQLVRFIRKTMLILSPVILLMTPILPL